MLSEGGGPLHQKTRAWPGGNADLSGTARAMTFASGVQPAGKGPPEQGEQQSGHARNLQAGRKALWLRRARCGPPECAERSSRVHQELQPTPSSRNLTR